MTNLRLSNAFTLGEVLTRAGVAYGDRPNHGLFVPLPDGAEWLSSNRRIHWTQRHRWTATWRETSGWLARAAKVPSLGPSRVIAELWMRPRRRSRIDPANYSATAKPIVDGLVDARIWPDDSSHWVTGPDMRLGPPVKTPHPEGVLLLIWGQPCCRDACCHHHRQEGGEAA
ncbi:hypothetical protein [Mycolicibacterium sp.]|uniref:hypothetical protein n=1 Tax=Mycolicibacterium sp. TaxID=2320850 RepID=UPI00355DE27C